MRVLGVCTLLLACQQPSSSTVFEIAGPNDPVLQMALSSQYSTMVYTFTNNGTTATSAGLLALSNLFSDNSAASAALIAYMADGDPLKFAAAAGIEMNADAIYVPAIDPGQSVTVVLNVPHNGKVDLVIRQSGSDFVGFNRIKITDDPTPKKFAVVSGKVVARSGVATVSATVSNQSDCMSTLTSSTTLLNVSFTQRPWDHTWPYSIGFDGDFNGDWYTDGTTARMIDVNAKLPTISGFVKFFYLCPSAGARVSAYADIATLYKKQASDTTLVIYFFDEDNNYISHAENWPLHGNNYRKHALYDAAIPAGTRKIAVVPMGYFAAGETDSSHYYNLTTLYEPAGKVTETLIGSDDFTTYSGWSESGGDWYAMPVEKWATAWNPAWVANTGTLPLDARMTKQFSLGSYKAGAALSVRAFVSSTFTDPSSFVQMHATFNTGQTVSASALATSAWADFDIRRTPIPAGATSVTIMFQMSLAAAEKSAAYVDTLKLWKVE